MHDLTCGRIAGAGVLVTAWQGAVEDPSRPSKWRMFSKSSPTHLPHEPEQRTLLLPTWLAMAGDVRQ